MKAEFKGAAEGALRDGPGFHGDPRQRLGSGAARWGFGPETNPFVEGQAAEAWMRGHRDEIKAKKGTKRARQRKSSPRAEASGRRSALPRRVVMTPLQARVKGFISDFIRDEGFSPSFQEIADGLGLKSRSSARGAVLRLQKRGHVTFLPGRSRSIQVADQTERLISAAERLLDRIAGEESRLGLLAAAAVAELDEVLSELRPPETRSRRRPMLRRGPGQGVDETEAERVRKLR